MREVHSAQREKADRAHAQMFFAGCAKRSLGGKIASNSGGLTDYSLELSRGDTGLDIVGYDLPPARRAIALRHAREVSLPQSAENV